MLRGTQKRVVRIRGGGSEVFEEAIFILKDRAVEPHLRNADMVSEATRLIAENDMCCRPSRKQSFFSKHRAGFFTYFLAGAATGSALIGAILWFIV